MNYERIYNQIIDKRRSNPCNGYVEKHHIIPRSLGGTDDVDNLVSLTAREHFICHYLLAKMYPKESFEWYKMNHAFMYMKCKSYNQDRYFNSKLYEALRGNFSSIMSYANIGKHNPNYGKRWIYSYELKENKSIDNTDPLPSGWREGRVFNWNKLCLCGNKMARNSTKCQECINIEHSEEINSLYKEFKDSGLSLTKFAKSIGKTQPGLTNQFRKHVSEYRQTSKGARFRTYGTIG